MDSFPKDAHATNIRCSPTFQVGLCTRIAIFESKTNGQEDRKHNTHQIGSIHYPICHCIPGSLSFFAILSFTSFKAFLIAFSASLSSCNLAKSRALSKESTDASNSPFFANIIKSAYFHEIEVVLLCTKRRQSQFVNLY